MSDPPIRLDYSNPLEEQPEGSSAVIEIGEQRIQITFPPRGFRSFLVTLIVAALFTSMPLVEWFKLADRVYVKTSEWVAAGVLSLCGCLLATFVLAEGVGAAWNGAALIATPGELEVHPSSWFGRKRKLSGAKGENLHVSTCGVRIGWKAPRI